MERELEKATKKEELKLGAAPSLREVELDQLKVQLAPLGLCVKEILSDGHCLYRAIADQLNINSIHALGLPINDINFISIRRIASDYLRTHASEFAPFVGVEADSSEYENYCR